MLNHRLLSCSTRRVLYGFTVAATLFPATARAQTTTRSFDELQRILKVGQLVIVTDASGQETKGRITDLSASSLGVLASDRRSFAEANVTRIRRTDPLGNGTAIGAGIGGAFAAVAIKSTRDQGSDAFYGWLYIGSWLCPAVGAISGALIDRVIGTGTVYLPPSGPPKISLSVSPSLARGRKGMLVSLGF